MSQVYGWMHVTRWCFLQSKINTVLQPLSDEMNIWPLTHSSVNDSGLENPPLILDSLQLQVYAVQKGLCVRAGLMPHLFLGPFSFFYMLHLSLYLYICLCADVCPMHAALFLSHRPHVWTSHTVNSSCMITLTHRPLNDHIILWRPWFYQ